MSFIPNISLTRLKQAFEAKEQPGNFAVSELIIPTYNMRDLAHIDRTRVLGAIDASVGSQSVFTIPEGEVHFVLSLSVNSDLMDADQAMSGNLGFFDTGNFLNPVKETLRESGAVVWADGIVFNPPLPMLPGYRIGFINGRITGGVVGDVLITRSYLHYRVTV